MKLTVTWPGMEERSPVYRADDSDYVTFEVKLESPPSAEISFAIEDARGRTDVKKEQVILDTEKKTPKTLALKRDDLGIPAKGLKAHAFSIVARAPHPAGGVQESKVAIVYVPERQRKIARWLMVGLGGISAFPLAYIAVALIPAALLSAAMKAGGAITASAFFGYATHRVSLGQKDWGVFTFIARAGIAGSALILAGFVGPGILFARVGNPRTTIAYVGAPTSSASFLPGWNTVAAKTLAKLEQETQATDPFCFVDAPKPPKAADCMPIDDANAPVKLEREWVLDRLHVKKQIVGCRTGHLFDGPVAAGCVVGRDCVSTIRDSATCALLGKPILLDADKYFPVPGHCNKAASGTVSVVPPFGKVPIDSEGLAEACFSDGGDFKVDASFEGSIRSVQWSVSDKLSAVMTPYADAAAKRIRLSIQAPWIGGTLDCSAPEGAVSVHRVLSEDIVRVADSFKTTQWTSAAESATGLVCGPSAAAGAPLPPLGSKAVGPDKKVVGTRLTIEFRKEPHAGQTLELPPVESPLEVRIDVGTATRGYARCEHSPAGGVKLTAFSVDGMPSTEIVGAETGQVKSTWSPAGGPSMVWICVAALSPGAKVGIGPKQGKPDDTKNDLVTEKHRPAAVCPYTGPKNEPCCHHHEKCEYAGLDNDTPRYTNCQVCS